MMRRSAMLLVVLLATVLSGFGKPGALTAQEEPPPVPEVTIVVTEDGYDAPETLVSGWYIVTLDNQTEEDIVADLVMLPEGREIDEFQNSLSTDSGGSTVPDWFEQVVFAGGPSALPQQQAQTLIELTPGDWTVLEVGEVDGEFAEISVTQAVKDAEKPEWASTVAVTMSTTEFAMPATIDPGYLVWSVDNTDARTHAFAIVQLPAALTMEQMLALLNQGVQPAGIDMSQSLIVGGIGLLSGGKSLWTGFELEAGHYVALDYVPQADGRTYAELGFLALFTVGEPG